MRLNKIIDKETINILITENKRLKRENQRLNEALNELQRYKDEYRKLIGDLKQVKSAYVDKITKFDKLEKEFRSGLLKIISSKGR